MIINNSISLNIEELKPEHTYAILFPETCPPDMARFYMDAIRYSAPDIKFVGIVNGLKICDLGESYNA